MTNQPKPKAARARPLRKGDEPPPTTIAALNAKLDRILENGAKQFTAVRDLALGNLAKTRSYRRLLWAVGALGLVSFILGVVAVQASADANAAKGQICRATQANRDLLRDVVVASYAEGNGQLDLRAFPSYPALEPTTKAWVDDLQSAISGTPERAPRDANNNRVPDVVDAILAAPVCVDVASGSRRGVAIILGGVGAAGVAFGVYEWRRRRHDPQPEP